MDAQSCAAPTRPLDQAWFADTLDAAEVDLGRTLRPADAETDVTLAGPVAGQPSSPGPTLPRLTWTDATAPGDPSVPLPDPSAEFTLVSLLGEGGMGRVHLARQRSLRREVALKTCKPSANSPAALRNLLHEATIMGRLEHPAVVPVHLLGADRDGRPALVMKRIDGVSWDKLLLHPEHEALASLGGDPLEAHLQILLRICEAVDYAHDRRVLHLDIKPDNVLVGRYGEVHLGDWGVAVDLNQVSEASAVVGTPMFMAPEMLDGHRQRLGPAADVFLLGATLHLILTGKGRHQGRTLREVLSAAAQVAPYCYPPEVAPALSLLANRATAADPGERPSVREFAMNLKGFLRSRALDGVAATVRSRIEQLQALVDQAAALGEDEAATMIGEFHRLATEAGFGLQQVRGLRPDDRELDRAAQSLDELLVDFALAQGNLAEAETRYRDLKHAAPQLAERIQALRLRQAEAAKRRAELDAMAAAQDPYAAVGQRLLVFGPLLAFGSLIWWLARSQEFATAGRFLVAVAAALTTAMAVATVALWKRVRTDVNRTMLWAALMTLALVTVHRALAVHAGNLNVPVVLRDDALLFACSALVHWKQGWPALTAGSVAAATAVLMVALPDQALAIFAPLAVVYLAILVVVPLVVRRPARETRSPTA